MADYRRLTRQAARRFGLDPHIFERQIGSESNFDPTARSKYAVGIAQFTPETARSLGVDPTKPKQALNAAAKLMAGYVTKYGGYENALRAYNAGPGAIKASHGYAETNNYVSKILGGRDPKKLGVATPGGAGGEQGAVGGTAGAGSQPQGSEGLAPLLQALAAQKPPVASGTLQAPAASAAPAMPAGLQTPVSSGGPAPKQDTSALLEAVRTLGGDVTHAPGTAGAPAVGGASGAVDGTGSALVQQVKAEADHIDQARVPYSWGGGHGGKQSAGSKVTPLDCSGAVSRVLGVNPRVSGQFEKWGKPGRGAVTVYANEHHVLMEINGHFFGTSATNPGGGAGWIKRKDISPAYLRNFTARHA